MLNLNRELVQCIKDNHLENDLLKGKFGIEKENIRINNNGELVKTPHSKHFGDKLLNPYITTDFSESQVEMITPVCNSIDEAYNYLETIQNVVSVTIDNEFLWPESVPPILPNENEIPLARYNTNEKLVKNNANMYRKYLADKYGRKKQLISGIHLNFSLDDDFINKLYNSSLSQLSYREYKDEMYMKIMRNITRLSWFIIKMFGSSPVIHETYYDSCNLENLKIDKFKNTISIRNGRCGYKNINNFYVPLNSLENYITSIREMIDSGKLIGSKEYYSVIRPKSNKGNLSAIEKHGIDYLELRLLDINPLFKLGVNISDLYLIHLLIILALILEDSEMNESLFYESINNNQVVAEKGRMDNLKINWKGKRVDVKSMSLHIMDTIEEVVNIIDPPIETYKNIIATYRDMVIDNKNLYSSIIYEQIKQKGFIEFHIKKAIDYAKDSLSKRFNFIGYEDMELSTQILILDAIKRGVKVEILDRNDNFIMLSAKDKVEYVKQATKTSKDNYSTVLIMENKLVTKKILESSGLKAPLGEEFTKIDLAQKEYYRYNNKNIVIKPNSTNFGIGITIFKESFTEDEYKTALDLAFQQDDTILIEEFIEGKEYRVLVIDNKVAGVLLRVPANVKGDGTSSIKQLVMEKNKNILRGQNYRKPLEKIKLGIPEKMFLTQQKLDFDSVIEKNRIVYLRENSNISTGGDSIDYTDVISDSLKEIAVKASKAVGASIVGVDLMTKDITGEATDNYSIIELNFNPAIHIHCYPYKGKNRKIGEKILDLLNL
ncbi:glutathione biosynthesis bifunctional protein GshAB [Vallitalea longa]|uniref:Glutathione biosynthesis bifunctional protein GshAB n=1 Tax=Vallitalea longa TaxID=2936439 RepID=A0A9W6DDG2_9FIRM|nr:bifunctional glutamate--cysteine ligase GshA/glutathione synthetase GshB [Vallitalea longa]GKX28786.1 glutathione biosynthesis bifunctional protein GshAB [Vallitalea longa]